MRVSGNWLVLFLKLSWKLDIFLHMKYSGGGAFIVNSKPAWKKIKKVAFFCLVKCSTYFLAM